MIQLLKEEIKPILIPAILENEGIGGLEGFKMAKPRPSSNSDSHVDPHEALGTMLKLLAR